MRFHKYILLYYVTFYIKSAVDSVVNSSLIISCFVQEIQGDPREPDLFKINTTQLFFKYIHIYLYKIKA